MTLIVAKRKLFRPKKIFQTTLSPKKVVLVKNGRVYFEIYQIFVNKQKEREQIVTDIVCNAASKLISTEPTVR